MTDAHGIARDQLRSFIERIERLEEEKKSIADDIKDVYGEAKGTGFDAKILREVIKIRKQDKDERAEREALLDTYMIALGMIAQPDFFDDEPQQREPVERKSAALLRSDGGLNILTKHEDIRTAPETAKDQVPSSEQSEGNGSRDHQHVHSRQTDEAKHGGQDGEPAGADHASSTAGSSSGRASDFDSENAGSNLALASHSDQPLTGGDHEEVADSRAANGEGAPSAALPAAGVTMEYVPPSGVKRLPFAHCFPELSKADYERLEKDIAANRVQTPIIRQGDVIVDGWARYLISRQYGMSYPIIEYTGTDTLLDAIELQRASRNFTLAQEKKIAADLAKQFPHRADEIMAVFGLAEVLEAAQ